MELIVDGVKFFYTGNDFPIVYVHGAGLNADVWRNQISDIGGVAIDLPNHGRSCRAEIRSLDDYAYFVARFVKKKFGKAVLCGHSMGGAIVQLVCRDYSVAEAAVLMSTGARLKVSRDIFEIFSNPELRSEIISMCFSDPAVASRYAGIFDLEAMHHDLLLCDRFDLLEEYRKGLRFEVPALVICGTRDAMTPLKFSEFLAEKLNAELVTVNSGHMPMLEAPQEVNAAIRRFVSSLGLI